MELGFLFWFFLIGLIVASLQDLKRREVDNWLNLFLVVGSFVFIFYSFIIEESIFRQIFFIFTLGILILIYFSNFPWYNWKNKNSPFYFLLFLCIIMVFAIALIFYFSNMNFSMSSKSIILLMTLFIVSNLFYYGRVFAGGDAKLLFSMSALFLTSSFIGSLFNMSIFIGLLMFSGAFYGLFFSVFLYFKSYKQVNIKMKRVFKQYRIGFFITPCIILLSLFFFSKMLLFIGLFSLLFMALFVFAKGLESVSLTKIVSGKELKEGDWLAEDIKLKDNVIKESWEGLSKNDLKLLLRKKMVKIKEGIPFVPSFLIAFLIYNFFGEKILSFVYSLF